MRINDITKLSEEEKIKFSDQTYELMAKDRLPFARENETNRTFIEGNHGQPATSRVIGHATWPATPITRAVPISTVLLNTKITQIIANPPIPVVSMKVDTEDENSARQIAVAIEKKLESVFEENYLYEVIHQWLQDACVNGVGWVQVTNDDQGIHLENLDFDEVLVYPKIKKVKHSPAVGKVFTGIISDYMDDSSYQNISKLSPSGKGGESIDTMMSKAREKLATPGNIAVKTLNTFKGVEWQTRVHLTDKKIERLSKKDGCEWIKYKKAGDTIMAVFAVSQGVLIKDTYADTDEYNIFPLTLTPGKIYQPSLVKQGLSTNRAIDNIITQVEFYAATALKFRVLANRDADIGPINNIHGGIVEWSGEPNMAPEVMQIRDIPQGLFAYLQELITLMNFIYGISPSSLGVQGSGQKSKAQAMEQARMTDFFNNAPQIKRLELALTKMTKSILNILAASMEEEEFAYEHMDNATGRKRATKVNLVGEKYADENPHMMKDKYNEPRKDLIIVRHDYPVEIQITQGLNYSSDSIRTQLVQLVQEGVLPQEILADIFSYGKLLEWIDMARRREAQQQQDEASLQVNQQQQQDAGKMQMVNAKSQAQYKIQELKGKQQLAQKTQPMLLQKLIEKSGGSGEGDSQAGGSSSLSGTAAPPISPSPAPSNAGGGAQ